MPIIMLIKHSLHVVSNSEVSLSSMQMQAACITSIKRFNCEEKRWIISAFISQKDSSTFTVLSLIERYVYTILFLLRLKEVFAVKFTPAVMMF